MPTDAPLTVFIHIGKTAGSTLNAMLLRHHGARVSPLLWSVAERILPKAAIDNSVSGRWLARGLANGCSHLEIHAGDPATFDAILAQSDWVSGHITRAVMAGHLSRIGRPARYFTVVRDPTAQVASHYQWWIEIFERGPWRFYRYDAFFRGLSRRIRATDNTDPRQIIPILSEHWSLFLNLQTNYVIGPRETLTGDAAAAGLDAFASVGVDNRLDHVFRAMTGETPPTLRRLNVSRSSLDRSVFYTPEMQAFLQMRNAADMMLYQVALGRMDGRARR